MPNMHNWWAFSAPLLRLVLKYRFYLSEYAISDKSNQPRSIKWSKTLFLLFAEKFLRLGLWPPVVGRFCKKCSDFDSNHLTFRIEPFGDFEFSFSNLETKMIIWRRLRFSKTALRIFLIFSPEVVLNMIFRIPKTVRSKQFKFFFEKLFSSQKITFSWIINEWEFFRKIGLSQSLPIIDGQLHAKNHKNR